jgi:hypothetical protein
MLGERAGIDHYTCHNCKNENVWFLLLNVYKKKTAKYIIDWSIWMMFILSWIFKKGLISYEKKI